MKREDEMLQCWDVHNNTEQGAANSYFAKACKEYFYGTAVPC